MKYIFIIICISLFLVFQSCTRVEGCNDPIAKNYNAEADKNCCCEYYQLRFNIEHTAGGIGTTFAYFTAYLDAMGDNYEVKTASILISKVELLTASGEAVGIHDSIFIPLVNGTNSWLRNDFSALRPGTFINDIGNFVELGSYAKIRFLVGLEGDATTTDGLDITDTQHPLSSGHSSGHYDQETNTYWYERWEVIRPSTADTLRFGLRDTLWVELNYPITVTDGNNVNIPLQIDYLHFFENVSFANDDSITIVQKIKDNTRDAFSIQ